MKAAMDTSLSLRFLPRRVAPLAQQAGAVYLEIA